MFIDQSMTRKVISIPKKMKVAEARMLMREHGIRHLPVVDDDNKLTGMITDRDIRSAAPPGIFKGTATEERLDRFADLIAADIMSTSPVTLTHHDTLQDALLLLQKTGVGALPVVDADNKLCGILSIRDVLRAFINVMGIGEPGILLCIKVEDKIGQLKKIVDAVTEENISFGSIMVARAWEKNKRVVFPYLLTNHVGPIKRKLTDMGYELLAPRDWIIDKLPE